MCGKADPTAKGCVDASGVDTSKPGFGAYFKESKNPPLTRWDFSKTWKEMTGAYPRLR